MAKTGIVYHLDYLKHNAGEWHPENPSRLKAIMDNLANKGLLAELCGIEPKPAEKKWIEANHTSEYISYVEDACKKGISNLDADTGVCSASYQIALLAAGGVLAAIDAIMEQRIDNGFCAVRPPGHHAERDRAMGFCLFNNVAIATRYIQKNYQLQKVLIVDWDVHHGNGTQNSFYDDPTVFYFSIHQWPHYPGSGLESEKGTGEGLGTTLNIPLSAGADDDDYIRYFNEKLIPEVEKYTPDFILISAGFDAHKDDPLAGMQLTEYGYAELTSILCQLSKKYCQDRLLSLLEGGYNLNALARSVESHLKVLMQ